MSKVVMIMKWEGVTADQYEKIRKTVNWEGEQPPGSMFHVAAFGNNALHVTDIWESAEQFGSFVQSRLMPGVQQAGIASQPHVEIYPMHALYVPNAGALV